MTHVKNSTNESTVSTCVMLLLPSLNKCNEEKRTKKFFQKIQFATANVGYKKESFHLNSNNTHTRYWYTNSPHFHCTNMRLPLHKFI